MAIDVTFNQNPYVLPTTGDMSWGSQVTAFLVDVAANAVTAASSQTLSNKILHNQPGVTAAPSFSFAQDSDTGMYQPGVGLLNLAVNAADVMLLDSSGVTVKGSLTADSLIGALNGSTINNPTVTGGTFTNPTINYGTANAVTLNYPNVLTGLNVGGTGISYATSAGHSHEFGWTGQYLEAFVDGTYEGTINTSVVPNTAPSYALGSSYWTQSADYTVFSMDAGWRWVYDRKTGALYWQNYLGANYLTIDGAGNASVAQSFSALDMTANRNIIAANNIAATGLLYSANTNMVFGQSGNATIIQHWPSWYWAWSITDGTLYWVAGTSPLWVQRASDRLCYNNQGQVGGHGPYWDISDAGVKVDVRDAEHGLNHILRMTPRTFRRLDRSKTDGSYLPRVELGFVAQDLVDILPEAVQVIGGLDDEPELLAVTTTPILAAAVNAIKTLTQRISYLEAAMFKSGASFGARKS